ncbi:trypsin-like peptidase domain-containing protein [Streptomyces sp. NPDC047123]|uniref:S1C family serine protease n=1 Tax=Streptomyces sp. NPDC047123 TaxID=3155622 RepID=UPI0033C04D36
MDEGKPTKANWWSRPRPDVPGAADQPPAPVPSRPAEPQAPADATDATDSAPEQPHPHGTHPGEPIPTPAHAPREAHADAAAQADRPGMTADPHGSQVDDLHGTQGDLHGTHSADPHGSQADDLHGTQGDLHGPHTADPHGSQADPHGTYAADPRGMQADPHGPYAADPRGMQADPHGSHADPHGTQAAPVASAEGAPEQAVPAAAQAPAPADRPRPLHDPDPYSTPPYGEPGPWAPAPPVQHPAATPAHGTQLPGTQLPPGAPHGGTPAHGTQLPGTQLPPGAPHGGTPAHGTQLPPGAPHGGTPAHGTQLPGTPHSSTPPHGTPPPAPVPGAPGHGTSGGTSGPPSYGGVVQAPMRQAYDPWNQPLQQIGSVPPEDPAKRRGRARKALFVGVALVALVSGLVGGATGAYLERNGTGDIELRQADTESKDRPRGSVAGIASAALPGVVTLHVSGDSAQGTGTGFVLDGKGHILTNNHVVEPAGTGGEVSVTFSGGETAKAEVVGRDAGYDLAVVKVSGVRGLRPLTLGNSENVQVGDPVVAIGAPFDLENTVTSGIISAKERPITAGGEKGDGSDISYVDALQTDAPINPGNSGGPLVDSRARVIGINSAIRSADEGSEPGGGQAGSIGLGFAIPINQGKRVAEELINVGKATHPVIGVTLDTDFNGDGARIADKSGSGGPAVNRSGPGDKAGLKPGDVITEVDGRPVHSSDELIVKVRAHRPGDRLRLTVERGGSDREVTLVLGSAGGS